MPNRLLHESSPYLLQHAHNPVDWYPWGEEAWEKARKENKLVLVSIGYSSCHWCHVMERQSFEQEAVGKLMNEHFVCIKVDREERPDVDQVYMSAVQLMTGGGGWPLNCFTLPDGRPIYGGTYFPRPQWEDLLVRLHHFYLTDPERARTYADELMNGLRQMEQFATKAGHPEFSMTTIDEMMVNWKRRFDPREGGPDRAPKFPLPNNYSFLLRYLSCAHDPETEAQVHLTLGKMAMGGIYDQIGGGFSRYSVDAEWKVPHFEKMLYDNAQLVTLYAEAHRRSPNPLYETVIRESLAFIERELSDPNGGGYAAVDADSEGEEGRFYTWEPEELRTVIGRLQFDLPPGIDPVTLLFDYYRVGAEGHWEFDRNILLRKEHDDSFAARHQLSQETLLAFLRTAKAGLLHSREKRERPGLDKKILLSWNALLLEAWCEAYRALGDPAFLENAIRLGERLRSHALADGRLPHLLENGQKPANPGFLDDYAFFAQGMISLYGVTFDEAWLWSGRNAVAYALEHFSDPESPLLWYTSDLDPPLVTRKKEVHDNVIPASNSCMARVLFTLGRYFGEEAWMLRARQMLFQVTGEMPRYGSGFSNWAILLLEQLFPSRELVLAGEPEPSALDHLRSAWHPHLLLAWARTGQERLPLLQGRYLPAKTLYYVCENGSCHLPKDNWADALAEIKG